MSSALGKDAGEVALIALKGVVAASDVFPPLKSAAGGIVHIAELVKVRIPSICRIAVLANRYTSRSSPTRKSGKHFQTMYEIKLR